MTKRTEQSLFFSTIVVYIEIGERPKPDTRTEQLIPMDYNKHISQKKNKSTGQNQNEYANLLFFLWLLLLNIVFSFLFFSIYE